MNNYKIKFSKEFKKSLKKPKKQGRDIDKLFDVIYKVSRGETLEKNIRIMLFIMIKDLRDAETVIQNLTGYKYLEFEIVLLLVNAGIHSNVLNKQRSMAFFRFFKKIKTKIRIDYIQENMTCIFLSVKLDVEQEKPICLFVFTQVVHFKYAKEYQK